MNNDLASLILIEGKRKNCNGTTKRQMQFEPY